MRVFGPAALAVSPPVGHIHVTVDDATWHWADASGAPIVLNGLAPGPHTILVQPVNANHQALDQKDRSRCDSKGNRARQSPLKSAFANNVAKGSQNQEGSQR